MKFRLKDDFSVILFEAEASSHTVTTHLGTYTERDFDERSEIRLIYVEVLGKQIDIKDLNFDEEIIECLSDWEEV